LFQTRLEKRHNIFAKAPWARCTRLASPTSARVGDLTTGTLNKGGGQHMLVPAASRRRLGCGQGQRGIIGVLSAVPFALAHVPLQFFLPGEVTAGSLVVAFVIYFVVSALVRPMLATFLRGTGDSLLLVALLHSVFNRTNNDDGIVATLTSGDARILAMAVGPVLLTVAVAIPIRRRLTRDHRLVLDAANRSDRATAGGGTTS
jgi:hypothetical protein